MSLVSAGELQQLVSTHGYWVVALIVGLESMGLPLPGETVLVLAAIYAATEPSFNIWVVIAVAAFGAIVGDNAGYWLGLRYGYALLLRYGERIGMFEARIKLGQYLFLKHGTKVVFLGRFVALLRILAAFLAGVNRMPWRTSRSPRNSLRSVRLSRMPRSLSLCELTGTFLITFKKPDRAGKTGSMRRCER